MSGAGAVASDGAGSMADDVEGVEGGIERERGNGTPAKEKVAGSGRRKQPVRNGHKIINIEL